MTIVVGIDGGGTKTRAQAYDADKSFALAGFAEAGACNIAAMPVGDALGSVQNAVAGAGIDPAQVVAVCAAVAGYSYAGRRAQFAAGLATLFPRAKVHVAPDYVAAFRSAFPDGSGILVVAGTGSVAYGADASTGRCHRAGAYGYLIEDSGSGYGVGREALAAVLAAIDRTGEPTILTQRIAGELGSAEWDALIEGVYSGSIDRVRIASLAAVVAAAEQDADKVAQRILMRAGGALARLTEAVYSAVFADVSGREDGLKVGIARVGSLWNAGPSLRDVFERSCLRFAPGAHFTEPNHTPAFGAALIACDLLD